MGKKKLLVDQFKELSKQIAEDEKCIDIVIKGIRNDTAQTDEFLNYIKRCSPPQLLEVILIALDSYDDRPRASHKEWARLLAASVTEVQDTYRPEDY